MWLCICVACKQSWVLSCDILEADNKEFWDFFWNRSTSDAFEAVH